jgi:hypothetical protein
MTADGGRPQGFDTLDALLRALLAHERIRRDSRLRLPSAAPQRATSSALARDAPPAPSETIEW